VDGVFFWRCSEGTQCRSVHVLATPQAALFQLFLGSVPAVRLKDPFFKLVDALDPIETVVHEHHVVSVPHNGADVNYEVVMASLVKIKQRDIVRAIRHLLHLYVVNVSITMNNAEASLRLLHVNSERLEDPFKWNVPRGQICVRLWTSRRKCNRLGAEVGPKLTEGLSDILFEDPSVGSIGLEFCRVFTS